MKIAICHLGYDNATRVTKTIERFWELTDTEGLDIEQFVFYYPYPLPDKKQNYREIMDFCRKWHDTRPIHLNVCLKNQGQDGNLMQMAKFLQHSGLGTEIFVPFDTDINPTDRQWLKDALKVFEADASCGAVVLNCKKTDNALQHQEAHDPVGGVEVRALTWPGGWAMCIMRQSFIEQGYIQYHSYYGATEFAIWEALKAGGFTAYMLEHHDDSRWMEHQDAIYNEWKHYAISRQDSCSLEDYISLGMQLVPIDTNK